MALDDRNVDVEIEEAISDSDEEVGEMEESMNTARNL